MLAPRLLVLLFALSVATITRPTIAQCPAEWLPGEGFAGTDDVVYATVMWDPDGLGPRSPLLVVAGDFTIAGNVLARNIASFDAATGNWSTMGSVSGGGSIRALAVLPTGELVAGGNFSNIGGVSAKSVARWDGVAWSALGAPGSGVTSGASSGTVHALAVMHGDLIMGGFFSAGGGLDANNIVRWSSSEGGVWSALGSGLSSSVRSIAIQPNGEIVVGGDFTGRIAEWDGLTWSALGVGLNGAVTSLLALPSGRVIAGGSFQNAGGNPSVDYVAEWNGAEWSALGPSGANQTLAALRLMSNGDVIAGGSFTTIGGVSAARVARWDGATWSALGAGLATNTDAPPVKSLCELPDGDVVAAGSFTASGPTDGTGVTALRIARWNGSAWSALNRGTDATPNIRALAALPDGNLLAAGNFFTIGGVNALNIARWTDTGGTGTWSAVGTGLGTTSRTVEALAVMSNGDIIAGGSFTDAAGDPTADYIARWNGTSWTGIGGGVTSGSVSALAVMPNGDFVAGGSFSMAGGLPANHVARWNGSSWTELGAGTDGRVQALLPLPNGDLIVGGVFSNAGGVPASRIARWDGLNWTTLGAGLSAGSGSGVETLALLPNGDVIAGGRFSAVGVPNSANIARWNGVAWSSMGNMESWVYALQVLPSGDLLAAGPFSAAGGVQANQVALWNGSAWSSLQGSVNDSSRYVNALALLINGDIAVGGTFEMVNGAVSKCFARYRFAADAPAITQHPQSASPCLGGPVSLAVAATGTQPMLYQWRRNDMALDTIAHPSASTPTLSFDSVGLAEQGSYDCVVANSCDSATSLEATVVICFADFNCSGFVEVPDIFAFLSAWFANDARADFDGSGLPVSVPDIFAFLSAWFAGCG